MDLKPFAVQLVSNPGWGNFFSELSKLYYDQWVGADTVEKRERLHVKQEVLEDFKLLVENAAVNVGERNGGEP
jgi:hypothetical protein